MDHFLSLGNGEAVFNQIGDAQNALAGFAFGKVPFSWPVNYTPGVLSLDHFAGVTLERYRWGYRTFDCAPSSPTGFSFEDVAVAHALDSEITAADLLVAEAIAPFVAEVLGRIPLSRTFLSLNPADLATRPDTGSTAYPLWEVYDIIRGLPDFAQTKTSKALHHKRPWLFPLVDSYTSEPLGHDVAWFTIYNELTANAAAFTALENWFASAALTMHGVALTQLRIHDILLWGALEGSLEQMVALGGPVRAAHGF